MSQASMPTALALASRVDQDSSPVPAVRLLVWTAPRASSTHRCHKAPARSAPWEAQRSCLLSTREQQTPAFVFATAESRLRPRTAHADVQKVWRRWLGHAVPMGPTMTLSLDPSSHALQGTAASILRNPQNCATTVISALATRSSARSALQGLTAPQARRV